MTNLICTRIIDEKICESEEAVQLTKDGFLACRTCRIEVANSQLQKTDRSIVQALDCDTSESVYIIRVSTGNIKIGKAKNLYERLRTLSCKFGAKVELLASTTGGYQTEARLHAEFDHLRITDLLGEQFEPEPELLWYADHLGIDSAGQFAAKRLEKYTFTGEAKTEPDYLVPAKSTAPFGFNAA